MDNTDMLIAVTNSGHRAAANRVEKLHGPFHCPHCSTQVVLKKGRVVVHHYAHKPQESCQYARETREHLTTKQQIADSLRAANETCSLEHTVGNQRADVLWVRKFVQIAIEIQHSNLSLNEMFDRTNGWAQKNHAVLWVVPWKNNLLQNTRCTPRQFEKWLHALYFGRVYYWNRRIIPVHFNPYYLENNDYGPRRSKRYRRVAIGREIEITDLIMRSRNSWEGGGWCKIPECVVMIDKLDTWWSIK